MAENTFPFMSEDWAGLQETYWKAWADMARLGPGMQGYAAPPPWGDMLDQWWRLASPQAPEPVRDFYGRLIDEGKAYFQLTESLLGMFSHAGQDLTEWRDSVDTAFADMKRHIGGTDGEGRDALHQMLAAFWELPMDTWQRTAAVMSGAPGDFMAPLKEAVGGPVDAAREQVHRFLSAPGLGYTREHQEQYQVLSRLELEYQAAMEAYAASHAHIARRSVDRFQEAVMARVEKGERLDTLQAVYDLWVDSCEEAYAEHVFSDDYAKVHGRVVNSLMALKRHSRAMVDETLGMLNMPTRKEMNTLQARFQDLRRDLRAMQASQGVTEDAGTPVEATAPTRRAAAKKTAAPGRTASKQASPGPKAPEAAPKAVPRRKTAAGRTTSTGRAKS
jgi:class III poly(R)-hydroxyalkanoic acid synthase PhaE subunit